MATICPDLSAHRKGNREADARLSSAGAAVSLRQAPAHTLPSFPVVGLGNKESSAGAAASLAHANKRSVELWKPNPDASTAGSRAAILAHRDHAGTLRKGKTPVKSEAAKEAVTPRDHGALLAATKAVKMKRQRADSMSVRPVSSSTYPRKDSGPGSGVPGLTSAEEDIERSPALRASRIHNIGTNLPREMYTEHPPVGIEVEEQRHQTALRASAISMAKQMYNAREKASEQASLDVLKATAAEDEKKKGSDSGKARVQQYLNLHDAARKLANERLKRIDDEGEFRAYRTYYSCDDPSLQQRRSTRVGMARRRAASDSSSTSRSVSGARDDMEQSKAIRAQMSQFSNLLAAVDDKKRRQDMERVLVAAQKNVHAQMLHMDEKVYQDTGRIPYATQVEWDREAQALAAERGEKRMEHFGKVEVGFGRFVERDAVDRVARDRVKPTIEDIDDQVEVQKAQEEGRRLDREYEKRHARLEKEREAELKADLKRAKKKSAIGGIGDQAEEQETPEEVRRLDMEYERHHAQLEKERDAELKAELKRVRTEEKEERRLSKDARRSSTEAAGTSGPNTGEQERISSLRQSSVPYGVVEGSAEAPTSPSPEVQHTGFRSFLSKLKSRSKDPAEDEALEGGRGKQRASRPGFVGGARLKSRNSAESGQNQRTKKTGQRRGSSSSTDLYDDGTNHRTSSGRDQDMEEARDQVSMDQMDPPRYSTGGVTGNPQRGSVFQEHF